MLIKTVKVEDTEITLEDVNGDIVLAIDTGNPDRDLGVATFSNLESAIMFSQALDKLILADGKVNMSTYIKYDKKGV